MKANVIITPNFQREAKKLIKKFQSLKSELLENPRMGTLIKENSYKIRLSVKSKGKGKSGGMRVITYVETEIIEKEEDTDVYLLSIYDKSDYESISDISLEFLINEVKTEIQQQKETSTEEE
ncbi:MAG: hypothetical protein SFU99_03530 [Saprospiraceae bacterium]|nr:hypothetical protein [Saprospiraceae bacterium]